MPEKVSLPGDRVDLAEEAYFDVMLTSEGYAKLGFYWIGSGRHMQTNGHSSTLKALGTVPFQRRPVPIAGFCGRVIGALEECEQIGVW